MMEYGTDTPNRVRNALLFVVMGVAFLMAAWFLWLRESARIREYYKSGAAASVTFDRDDGQTMVRTRQRDEPLSRNATPAGGKQKPVSDETKRSAIAATYLLYATVMASVIGFTIVYALLRASRGWRRLVLRRQEPPTPVVDAWSMYRLEEIPEIEPYDDEFK